jgi:hypothetical protein
MMQANLAARMVHCASWTSQHDARTDREARHSKVQQAIRITLQATELTVTNQLNGAVPFYLLKPSGKFTYHQV